MYFATVLTPTVPAVPQTYRGPSKGYGYDVFAPWGYYVTQPEDDKGYGYH